MRARLFWLEMWGFWVTWQRQFTLSMQCLASWSKHCEHLCHHFHWSKRQLVGMVDLTWCASLLEISKSWMVTALPMIKPQCFHGCKYPACAILLSCYHYLISKRQQTHSLLSRLLSRGKSGTKRPEFPCEQTGLSLQSLMQSLSKGTWTEPFFSTEPDTDAKFFGTYLFTLLAVNRQRL